MIRRCPRCSAENDRAAIVCGACQYALPHRDQAPEWQRILGWTLVWGGFTAAFVNPTLFGFALLTCSAGWVLFLDDDWVLRVLLGAVLALVMCQLAAALGMRFWLGGVTGH
jgi:hypothetical protein